MIKTLQQYDLVHKATDIYKSKVEVSKTVRSFEIPEVHRILTSIYCIRDCIIVLHFGEQ